MTYARDVALRQYFDTGKGPTLPGPVPMPPAVAPERPTEAPPPVAPIPPDPFHGADPYA